MKKTIRTAAAIAIAALTLGSVTYAASCCANGQSCEAKSNVPDNTLAPEEQAAGWQLLFDGKTMNGWGCTNTLSTGWEVKDGALMFNTTDHGYLYTKEQYGDFEFKFDFMVDKGTNSGVFFRWTNLEDPVQTGIEMQVIDCAGKKNPDKHDCGAVYDILAPTSNPMKPALQWNTGIIKCRNNFISITINGKRVVNMDLDKYTEPHKNIDGTGNKFDTAYKNMPRKGYIGFQDHGNKVWYKNVKIREL